ncbi:BQ5605_C013g07293 [Microbotryum silenes-dioicae]|uniref:BQ5605_C013g07293 protein n=1 Tax=Microbotryum silenes-dioicae TaxID=796604 RepID=A0A2X0NNW2_9BASI|nr:BQ5605_C013g07293 [Microbotryum silenes-dioicae]
MGNVGQSAHSAASPSFSLLLFTPYPSHLIPSHLIPSHLIPSHLIPSHLIPSPLNPSPLIKGVPTQPSYHVADGERRAQSVDDVDRLAAIYAEQRTTISSLKA